MTPDRPDVAPCRTCRWRDDDECILRGRPRTGPEGPESTRMPLPRDLGASCPPRLWQPCAERWYDSPILIRTSVRECEAEPGLPQESDRQLHREISAGAERAGLPIVKFRAGQGVWKRKAERARDVMPYRED